MNRRNFLRSMSGLIVASQIPPSLLWPHRRIFLPPAVKNWYDDENNFDISKVPPAGTDPELEKQIRVLHQVWLAPSGLLYDGDGNIVLRNDSNVPVLFQRHTFVKGNWECKNGVAIIEGINEA